MDNSSECTLIAEKTNTFVYKKTFFDKEGWADATKYRPIPFDIVLLKTERDKELCGWWNKVRWVGLRLTRSDKITKWKRRKYEQVNL